MYEEDVADVRADTLRRENDLYLKVIGGLGTLVLLLVSGFFSYWISTVSGKFDGQQSQLQRQWDVLNQRAERITTVENRLGANDALTAELVKDVREIRRDQQRVKTRLKMED